MLLQSKGRLTEQEALTIMVPLVAGIIDLYRLGIVHRDLKQANILLNFPKNKDLMMKSKEEKFIFFRDLNLLTIDMEVKIADFGFAKETRDALD